MGRAHTPYNCGATEQIPKALLSHNGVTKSFTSY